MTAEKGEGEKKWKGNILEVFLWGIQKTILEETEHFRNSWAFSQRQMVSNEEWESGGNEIKRQAVDTPHECGGGCGR